MSAARKNLPIMADSAVDSINDFNREDDRGVAGERRTRRRALGGMPIMLLHHLGAKPGVERVTPKAAHWPYDEGPIADHLNSTRKHVASITLERPDWNNSSLITGDVADYVALARSTSDAHSAVADAAPNEASAEVEGEISRSPTTSSPRDAAR